MFLSRKSEKILTWKSWNKYVIFIQKIYKISHFYLEYLKNLSFLVWKIWKKSPFFSGKSKSLWILGFLGKKPNHLSGFWDLFSLKTPLFFEVPLEKKSSVCFRIPLGKTSVFFELFRKKFTGFFGISRKNYLWILGAF